MTDAKPIPEPTEEDRAIDLSVWYQKLTTRSYTPTEKLLCAIRRAYHAERKLAELQARGDFITLWQESITLGFSPSVYARSANVVRAHWNAASNAWGEGNTPLEAMLEARKAWVLNPGCAGDPVDEP